MGDSQIATEVESKVNRVSHRLQQPRRNRRPGFKVQLAADAAHMDLIQFIA
jgi:hypothetical protein